MPVRMGDERMNGITYLLVRHRGNRYSIYSPDTYGADTWGMNTQEDLIFKRKHWYATYWRGGSFELDIDDYEEETRLNVVLESNNPSSVFTYLIKHRARAENIENIRKDIDKIQEDWKKIDEWAKGGSQE